MKLALGLELSGKSKKRKTPTEAFPACPSCGSKHLVCEVEELFCTFCHWNSIEASAEAFVEDGGFDAALRAYEEELARAGSEGAVEPNDQNRDTELVELFSATSAA